MPRNTQAPEPLVESEQDELQHEQTDDILPQEFGGRSVQVGVGARPALPVGQVLGQAPGRVTVPKAPAVIYEEEKAVSSDVTREGGEYVIRVGNQYIVIDAWGNPISE